MKILLTLLGGIVSGVALFGIALVYNPFIGKAGLSPLAVTDAQTIALSYSAVAAEDIVFTNNGESRIQPHPQKVLQLWEASIRQTSASVKVLRDGRGNVAGMGIKISSLSEATRLLSGNAAVDSIWYVYLPGRGSIFIEQTENYWDYIREVVLPAYRSSADTWAGMWLGNLTAGPGVLGTAMVWGGSGEFAGLETVAVESLSVRAWRVEDGPIAAKGQLLIELPQTVTEEVSSEVSSSEDTLAEAD